jgi:replicative DNA helicase
MEKLTLPPHNLDAEAALLGVLLTANGNHEQALATAHRLLRPADFYSGAHAALFGVVMARYERQEPIDLVLVGDELRRLRLIDKVGGDAALAGLVADCVATPAYANHYAVIVADHARRRRLIAAHTKAIRFLQECDDVRYASVAEELEADLIAMRVMA